jgi:hypothetical protein
MVLFPYIVRMEEAAIQNEPVLPPPFGTVQNPVGMMIREHEAAGETLRGAPSERRIHATERSGCTQARQWTQAKSQARVVSQITIKGRSSRSSFVTANSGGMPSSPGRIPPHPGRRCSDQSHAPGNCD